MTLSADHDAPQKIDVVIADDHPVLVFGVRTLLENAPGIRVVATAVDIAGLLTILDNQPCDVLVCDFTFADEGAQDGMHLIAHLLRTYPRMKIVLLTAHEDLMLIRHVLTMGVAGFIGKSKAKLESLPVAVHKVYSGGIYLAPEIKTLLAEAGNAGGGGTSTDERATLTKREFDVVHKLLKGMSVSEIARETGRSIKTISSQKMSAMQKLGARNDAELAIMFDRISEADEVDPSPNPLRDE
ncbi:hypothetical protein BWP39_09890 [Paraburkholderia acidicola]|uniref:Transcriptional regulatory protein RcsB n=1 Tax=Paraburkholderia acidicola TaxID=1912599 RepID=A0A2A4F291_9BURK|nr:response regulator transcription factor [Paraburkholderia acidicola]PCE27087.1 hypothetical protein BWP39_09890 [Paraburkholderia acidicola]